MSNSCDPSYYNPPVFFHGISQARILEWVAISLSRGPSPVPNLGIEPVLTPSALTAGFFTPVPPGEHSLVAWWQWVSGSSMPDSCYPVAVARQAPLSIGFYRQEYWSGLPFPSPGYLPYPGSNPGLLHCRQTLYQLSHGGSTVCGLLSSSSPWLGRHQCRITSLLLSLNVITY